MHMHMDMYMYYIIIIMNAQFVPVMIMILTSLPVFISSGLMSNTCTLVRIKEGCLHSYG